MTGSVSPLAPATFPLLPPLWDAASAVVVLWSITQNSLNDLTLKMIWSKSAL